MHFTNTCTKFSTTRKVNKLQLLKIKVLSSKPNKKIIC